MKLRIPRLIHEACDVIVADNFHWLGHCNFVSAPNLGHLSMPSGLFEHRCRSYYVYSMIEKIKKKFTSLARSCAWNLNYWYELFLPAIHSCIAQKLNIILLSKQIKRHDFSIYLANNLIGILISLKQRSSQQLHNNTFFHFRNREASWNSSFPQSLSIKTIKTIKQIQTRITYAYTKVFL
jgi:hypothetical protein